MTRGTEGPLAAHSERKGWPGLPWMDWITGETPGTIIRRETVPLMGTLMGTVCECAQTGSAHFASQTWPRMLRLPIAHGKCAMPHARSLQTREASYRRVVEDSQHVWLSGQRNAETQGQRYPTSN